ncbi:MAG: HNH endonuclease [Bacteroidales bacterium]|jgi:hypothetical protein|nr:HNH endonuclease [Bacteroidales bacterium]
MNCIFCHAVSDNCKSIEHIIPESLGNKEHTLWKGAVCDKCNNYFATKIEKELLEQPYFVATRHNNVIKTKKGHLVPNKYLFPHKQGGWQDVWFDYNDNGMNIIFEHNSPVIQLIKDGKINKMIVPICNEPEPNNYILSRFLAKCAFEYIMLIFDSDTNNYAYRREIIEFLREKQFDSIRKYARYGDEVKFWKYHQRRIYGEETQFIDKKESDGQPYEVLHEMCLFVDKETVSKSDNRICAETYFVIVIMGIEYVINIGEPEIKGYEKWLQKNNYKSPIERNYEKRIK